MNKLLCVCLVLFGPGLCLATERGAESSKYVGLDISNACNMGFADPVADDSTGGWTDQGPTNDLSAFPVAKKTFASVNFKIVDPTANSGRSCIMLQGSQRTYFPSEVVVAVDAHGAYIYLLHATAWTSGVNFAGKIELRYDSGQPETIPVVINRDVADWWRPRPLENGKLGWIGEIKMGETAGTYVSRFENPFPERKISQLAFRSGDAVWGIIAVSLSSEKLPLYGDMEIINPEPGQLLCGTVDIQATIPPEFAQSVICRLGSSSWQRLEQKGCFYTAKINTTPLDNGHQSLLLVIEMPGKRAPYIIEHRVKITNEYHYYLGDFHAHTSQSDGKGLPADALRHARDVAKLDFFTVSDHDHSLTFAEYEETKRQAREFNKEGEFVAIAGFEWSRAIGHINVLEAETCFLSLEPDVFYREVQQQGLLAKFNHPGRTAFNDFAYSFTGDMALNLVEVRSEEEEIEYIKALNQGWHVGADGSQDTHDETWGEGPHWTVVLATQLTKEQILDAARNRRTYSTGDKNLELFFELGGNIMGSCFASTGDLPVRIRIHDPDPEDKISEVIVYEDGKPRFSTTPDDNTCLIDPVIPAQQGKHYYFVKVLQRDGDKAWSSPIWVDCFNKN